MRRFSEFVSQQERQNKKHLETLHNVLTKAGFKVKDHTENSDPYIFVNKPKHINPILENLSFNGVRIYIMGNDIVCYRIANREDTEPYGKTYVLNIKEEFKALLDETHEREKIGHRIIKYVIDELKTFFIKSAVAEKEGDPSDMDSQMGAAVMGGAANDYANTVQDSKNSRM